MMFEH